MTQTATQTGADVDTEAREALWQAICEAAAQLVGRCTVSLPTGVSAARPIDSDQPVPEVATWQLAEGLSLLGTLLRADGVHARSVDLFTKLGPLEINEDGATRHLWAHPHVRGERSDLGGRPDLLVTSSPHPPTPANVLRAIEVKCRKTIGAQVARAEFGKAHDLRVATYFIWTFYSPSRRVVEGAKRLGLDVVELGFDTPRRQDLVTQPAALLSHVVHSLEEARGAQRFAKALEDAGQEARRKLLGP
jgi:hypothetical protein